MGVEVKVKVEGRAAPEVAARHRRGQITSDLLPLVLGGLVVVYAAHTTFHLVSPTGVPMLALGTAATGLAFAIAALLALRRPVPAARAGHAAVAAGALILVNIGLHYALRPDPATILQFVVFMLAASALLLDTWAVVSVLAATVMVWLSLTLILVPAQLGGPSTLDMFVGLATGLILRAAQAHILRVLVAGEVRLHEAQKLEAVGRLAGGVAHDFNNQLTVIRLNARGAMRAVRKLGDDEAAADLRDLMQAADRAAALTDDLLTLARRGRPAGGVVELGAALAGASTGLRRVLGEGIELSLSPPPEPTPVRIDPEVLGKVIVQLAQNARDAMPFGGRFELSAAEAAGVPPPLGPGRYVCLAARDTGVGMDESVRARLFEPFFTTKPRGTGLGLATAYGAVQQSGGTIVVDSRLGQGATFKVYLPVAKVAEAAPGGEPQRA